MTSSNPSSAAKELISSLRHEHQERAETVISALLEWSVGHQSILVFDDTALQYPHVGFKTLDGNVMWLARSTTGGDAKVEVLTRTANGLPTVVLNHLLEMLEGVVPEETVEGSRVIQTPIAGIGSESLARLKSALDFAMGAITALAISDKDLLDGVS